MRTRKKSLFDCHDPLWPAWKSGGKMIHEQVVDGRAELHTFDQERKLLIVFPLKLGIRLKGELERSCSKLREDVMFCTENDDRAHPRPALIFLKVTRVTASTVLRNGIASSRYHVLKWRESLVLELAITNKSNDPDPVIMCSDALDSIILVSVARDRRAKVRFGKA
jgi:hypothetical protein